MLIRKSCISIVIDARVRAVSCESEVEEISSASTHMMPIWLQGAESHEFDAVWVIHLLHKCNLRLEKDMGNSLLSDSFTAKHLLCLTW